MAAIQALFDVQLASIKHYSVASFSEDSKLHFITYRYAQLTASLLQLNTDYQVGTSASDSAVQERCAMQEASMAQ